MAIGSIYVDAAAVESERNPASRHTEFSLSVENESRLARDGTAEPVSRNQIIRRGKIHIIPCPADHEQDWEPYPVDPYSAESADHTYPCF